MGRSDEASGRQREGERPLSAANALIVKQAEAFGVTILLVRQNTMETIEAIEQIFGKSRQGQPEKLAEFEALTVEHVDMHRLYQAIGLTKK